MTSVEKQNSIEDSIEEASRSAKQILHEILKITLPEILARIERPKQEGSIIYKKLKQIGFFDRKV